MMVGTPFRNLAFAKVPTASPTKSPLGESPMQQTFSDGSEMSGYLEPYFEADEPISQEDWEFLDLWLAEQTDDEHL